MRRLVLLTLGAMLPCLIACLFGQQAGPGQEAPRLKGPTPFTRETPAPPMQRQITDDVRRRRNYPDQPPLIPHAIEGYALDLNANKCLSCHSRKFTEQSQGADDQRDPLPRSGRQLPGRRCAPALCLSGLPCAANDGEPARREPVHRHGRLGGDRAARAVTWQPSSPVFWANPGFVNGFVRRSRPGAPEDLKLKACALAGALLELGGIAAKGHGASLAVRPVQDGRAWTKLQRICLAQG